MYAYRKAKYFYQKRSAIPKHYHEKKKKILRFKFSLFIFYVRSVFILQNIYIFPTILNIYIGHQNILLNFTINIHNVIYNFLLQQKKKKIGEIIFYTGNLLLSRTSKFVFLAFILCVSCCVLLKNMVTQNRVLKLHFFFFF